MAELSKGQLEKHGNVETLVNKFFSTHGLLDTFLHKDGQFKPHALVIVEDGKEIEAFESDEDDRIDEALARVKRIVERKKARDGILFVGRFVGNNQIKTVPLTELVKTEEFGGKTGAKVNRGNEFEDHFLESLQTELSCLSEQKKYTSDAKKLIEIIGKDKKCALAEIKKMAEKNQSRALGGGSGGLYVTAGAAGGSATKNIGSTVTDITTYWGPRKEEVYLSLKYGTTLTFINSGVGKIFTNNDYKTYFSGYSNQIGNKLFEIFGIDPILYAKTFNAFPHKKKMPSVDVTQTCDKGAIQDLLEYAIGYGYWMVHGGLPGGVKIFEVDQAYMKKAASITGSVEIKYGGARGLGKRVDIHMESSEYKFMWNLRNKQSGLYPTHIMCDYKKK